MGVYNVTVKLHCNNTVKYLTINYLFICFEANPLH